MRRMNVIAVDGPAASGKGTIARALAKAFAFDHLDTGLQYRAVGFLVVDAGRDPGDEDAAISAARKFRPGLVPEDRLRRDVVIGQAASKVAAFAEVRRILQAYQRDFAHHPPQGAGAVLDGRDIGTVICPDAGFKIFVTASVEARARRRTLELKSYGMDVTEPQILGELKERDLRDSSRATDPLHRALDATLLDTTHLSIDAAVAAALSAARQALAH